MKQRRRPLILFILLSLSLVAGACHSAPVDTESQEPSLIESEPPPPVESAEESVIPEGVSLIDNDLCLFRITGTGYDVAQGYLLDTYVENRSSDTFYNFHIMDAAIDSVSAISIFFEEIAPGHAVNSTIALSDDSFLWKLTSPTDITLTMAIHDAYGWSNEPLWEETVHYYPSGEENASSYVREPQPEDIVIADTEDFSFILLIGPKADSSRRKLTDYYWVNRTDTALYLLIDVDDSVSYERWTYSVSRHSSHSIYASRSEFGYLNCPFFAFTDPPPPSKEPIHLTFRVYDNSDYVNPIFTRTIETGL